MYRALKCLFVLMLALNFTSCFEVFKTSYFSLDINESRNNKSFLSEYVVSKKDIPDSIDFNYKEIWIEKNWSNYLDKNGKEKFDISDSTAQLVINFTDERIFNGNGYLHKFIIEDDKRHSMGSGKGVLFFDSDSLINCPTEIKLFIVKVNGGINMNSDTVRIGMLLLKRV